MVVACARAQDILGNVLNHMRTEMVRHESGRPSALFAPDDASELRVTIGRLLATLAALDEQIVPRVESEGEHGTSLGHAARSLTRSPARCLAFDARLDERGMDRGIEGFWAWTKSARRRERSRNGRAQGRARRARSLRHPLSLTFPSLPKSADIPLPLALHRTPLLARSAPALLAPARSEPSLGLQHQPRRPQRLAAHATDRKIRYARIGVASMALLAPRLAGHTALAGLPWGARLVPARSRPRAPARQCSRAPAAPAADIYMSRVSNMLKYTPYVYYRNAQQSVAHDTAHDAALIGGDWLISATQQLKLELEQAARAASEASNREH